MDHVIETEQESLHELALPEFAEKHRTAAVGQATAGDLNASISLIALDQAITATQELTFGTAGQLGFSERAFSQQCKRLFDVCGAVLVLILIAPVLAVCAVLVYLSSPGPILYSQRRLGKNGNLFSMWKFRSMCADADDVLERYLQLDPIARREWEANRKLTKDPRVTRIGAVMRRLSLDELPQLWNVIRGDMSLIGPRPIVSAEVSKYAEHIWAYYACRPGMTGLWQVSGRSDTTYETRVSLDRQYFEDWSLRLDAIIFLKTFKVLLNAAGAY